MPDVPHAERVLAWIEELATPLVQLWGWPGSGRSAIAAALVDRGGQGVSAAVARDPERWAAAVAERPRGWLVCPAPPIIDDDTADAEEAARRLRQLAAELPAGRRLLVVTARRLAISEPACAVVGPERLALTPAETARLWRDIAGEELSEMLAERLTAAADGWYRPLRLAAEAVAADGSAAELVGPTVEATAASLAALPPVEEFLRDEVAGSLASAERAALAAFAAGEPPAEVLAARGWLRREWAEPFGSSGTGEARPPHLVTAIARRSAGQALARAVAVGRTAPAAIEPRVRVFLLGTPRAEQRAREGGGDGDGHGDGEGWRPLRWPLKRSFLALAFLASAPEHRATREDLLEALWPEADEATVERNFHPTLSHLRRGLRGGSAGSTGSTPPSPPLLLSDGAYRLNPDYGWWTDLEAFTAAIERGRRLADAGRTEPAAAAYEEAWRLHAGGFLEGFYQPWVARRREAVQGRFLDLLRDLGAVYERLGRRDDALDAYRALLARDPLQERIHTAVMRLYAAAGRRDLVRRQYRHLGALLREELGVEPLPETTEEYHRLMR